MTWRDVCAVADLEPRDVVGRVCAGREIAIYRLDGRYLATSGLCTHGAARLCEGEVVEGLIECPLHFGLFDIATGAAQGAPVTRPIATYPVRVVGARLEVELPEEAS